MQLLNLDTTTKSIQIKLAGSVTTTQLDWTSHWADDTGTVFTEGSSDGVTNNVTAVTVVASPASSTRRVIKNITVFNRDTASAVFTLIYNDNGTLRNITTVTLPVGYSWDFSGTTVSTAPLNMLSITPTVSTGGSSGIIIPLTSTETQGIGDAVQIKSDGTAHLAKADVIADASTILLSTASVTGSATNTYLVQGVLRLSSSPSWAVGGTIYLTTTGTTGNTLTQTAPSATNNVIQVLGVALAADTLYFNPCLVQVEHA
jgi:hypothetical protein